MKKRISIKMMVTLSLLIALEVVLSRFLSIQAWNFKIGFAFVPLAIAAILYGPVGGAIAGGISDLIGAILFPIGAYFPGFTLTSILMGLVLGIFLHKKQDLKRVVVAVCINQLILSLLVNSLWISIMYESAYWVLLTTRVFQSLLMIPIQIFVIYQMAKMLKPYFSKVK